MHAFTFSPYPRSLVKPFNSDTVSVIANFAKLSQREQNLLLGKEVSSTEKEYIETNVYRMALNRLCQFIQEEKQYSLDQFDIRDLFRVIVVEPQQHSGRIRVQSGAFLVSAFHDRFERVEIERQISEIPVYAHYVSSIPYGCKPDILEDLNLFNVRKESLYPGLDESAKAITSFYEHLQAEEYFEESTPTDKRRRNG